jgi:formylglycine-generating enzyme required for sulfatase activity
MSYKLARGGSWYVPAVNCRSAYRYRELPSDRYSSGGFRVVKDVEPSPRVFRGGSWESPAGGCRSAYRSRYEPSYRNNSRGFRVVKEVEPSSRCFRGGSYSEGRYDLLSSCKRDWLVGYPPWKFINIGFRVVTNSNYFTFNQKKDFTMAEFLKTIKIEAGTDINNNPVAAFEIGETPITQAQWVVVMGSLPEQQLSLGNAYEPDQPVVYVSYHDCEKFCEVLSERMGEKYRLPTGKEWEFACRAGTTTMYSCLDEDLKDHAVFAQQGITDVKTKQPNPWGLYDMHGLVWEWTQD